MNILYITSMYPTKKAPYGGVFITRRIEALTALDNHVIAIALVKSEKLSLRLFRSLLRKKQKYVPDAEDILTPGSTFKYQVVYIKVGIWGELLDKLSCYKYSYSITANKLCQILSSKKFDVVHAHWLYPTGWLAEKVSKKLSAPCVITCHGSDINVFMKRKKYRNKCISTLENARCVEFVSNVLLNNAKSMGYSGNNAVVAPNGIVEQTEFFRNKKRDIITVGFVGNLIDVKRIKSFPKIFRTIYNHISKNIEFLIVGSGELSEWLKNECEDMPLIFTGQLTQNDVFKKMAEMDVMILPSKNEGWPCVVLEAQSCGTPVLGSDKGGIPEAIGDIRFIVPDGDLFELRFAERVIDVLNGRIKYDKGVLIDRSRQFTWIKLQRQAMERYAVLKND